MKLLGSTNYRDFKESLKIAVSKQDWSLASELTEVLKNSNCSNLRECNCNLRSSFQQVLKEAISQEEYQLIEKISQSLIGKFNSNQKSDGELIIYNDLGCDKLDFVELMMAVEEEFELEISDEIQEQTDTVEKLYDLILSSS